MAGMPARNRRIKLRSLKAAGPSRKRKRPTAHSLPQVPSALPEQHLSAVRPRGDPLQATVAFFSLEKSLTKRGPIRPARRTTSWGAEHPFGSTLDPEINRDRALCASRSQDPFEPALPRARPSAGAASRRLCPCQGSSCHRARSAIGTGRWDVRFEKGQGKCGV